MSANIDILGIPWDMGASLGRPGARYAPDAIRSSFKWINRRITDGQIYDVEQKKKIDLKDIKISDLGDLELCYGDLYESLNIMQDAAEKVISKNHFLIALGGDHGVSLPLIKALHNCSQERIGLIHFDAHLDLLDENQMQGKYSQSSEIYRAMELERVNPENIVQIGVRGYNFPEAYDLVNGVGITQFTPQEIQSEGVDSVIRKTLEIVSEKTDKVYLTFDIDVLDPAFAPGTGADEPGGLFPLDTLKLVAGFAPHIACMDIVEVNPTFDLHGITSAFAAKLIFTTIINRMNGEF